MAFKGVKQDHIEINLDLIFNENGYIDPKYEKEYRNNEFVKTIKLIRTKNTPMKIGDAFLYNCQNLTTIDLSSLSQVTQIGGRFLCWCENLTAIDLSSLSRVTQDIDKILKADVRKIKYFC